ncbi:MAG: hypothetical protein IPO44_00645 [Candidatus Microthrix sp.]|nr:hypothetical protein [Candidatus Microthrix sp.]MBK9558127.1 hypothetical protein [Candidatus Microthrix sp.]
MAILDEAHTTEEVISSVCGIRGDRRRFAATARAIAAIVTDPALIAQIDSVGSGLSDDLEDHRGERLDSLDDALMLTLSLAQAHLSSAMDAVRKVPDNSSPDVATRKARAMTAATALADDLTKMVEPAADLGALRQRRSGPARMRLAPLAVAEHLDRLLWNPENGGAGATSWIPTTKLTGMTPMKGPSVVGLATGRAARAHHRDPAR